MVFVDTGAWIALADRSDQYHEEAKRIYARLKQDHIRLITSDYIVDETVTRLRYDSSHQHAVRFLDLIARAEEIGVLQRVIVSPDLFEAAVALFRQYDTATLSFTDCTSFAICDRFQISGSFAFDQHFHMRGITLCLP